MTLYHKSTKLITDQPNLLETCWKYSHKEPESKEIKLGIKQILRVKTWLICSKEDEDFVLLL